MKKHEKSGRRTRDEWRAVVAEWKASGQSAREFAAARGLSRGSLFYWSSELAREAPTPAAKLLPVRVMPSVVPTAREVELTVGSVRVRLDGQASPAYVAALARALVDATTP
ncbi:MAG: hypothetical protein RL385_4943 [Pseudomonadota bacterium]|jgi:hypothetical protein